MDNLTQVQHDDPHDSSLPEGAVLLNSASEAGNWHLVRDVISDADVSPSGIRQSFLLQKLESATVDHHLVRDILKEIFSSEASVRTMKSIAQDVLIKAAHCDNWEFLIDFLLTTESLFDDETSLLSVVRLMASSQMLQANPFLHMDVFSALWKHANQKIIDSKDNGVQNTLVQMAAELNMWSRVCDLLVTKPDLNLLDREGLSVLHRLVMCPDSRFDSLLPVVLENGADVHIKTKKGDTILHLTAKHQKITTSLPPLHLPDSKDQDKREQAKTKILEEYRSQCAESKRQLLAKLISSCQNLDDQDDLGNTAMIVAAKTDNWEFMKLLLEHGARADIVDLYQRSVLHILATKQTFTDALACRNLVALCLSRGAEVNSRDVYGNSVLHLTVQSRHWILFELLIDCGAEPGHVDSEGYNVFHRLALTEGENTENICLLFSLLCLRYSYLDTLCRAGYTVLHMAASQQNWTLVRHLVHLGASINLYNKDGFNVLHIVAMTTTCTRKGEQNVTNESIENDQTELLSIVDLLIEKGADIEIRCSKGDTALHLAAKRENWIMVSYLIERGANLNAMDSKAVDEYQTVFFIHRAAAAGNIDVVDVLLNSFDDVNITDCNGFTLLHKVSQCCSSSSVAVIRGLLIKGADIDKRCPGGDTALQLAAKSGNWLGVLHLAQSGARTDSLDNEGMSVLHRLIHQLHLYSKSPKNILTEESLAVLLFIFTQNVLTNQKDLHGNTFLHLAVTYKQWHLAVGLLTRGASLGERDSEGYTALHRLAQMQPCPKDEMETCSFLKMRYSHLDILDFIDGRVFIDARDPYGNTALLLSAENNNWDIFQKLLLKDANPCVKGCNGVTLLHLLAKAKWSNDGRGSEGLLCQLLKNLILQNLDVSARDPEGNTPIQVAAKHGNMDMVERLLEFHDNVNETDSEGFTLLSRVAQSLSPRCERADRYCSLRSREDCGDQLKSYLKMEHTLILSLYWENLFFMALQTGP
ncbi:uncharacterized protein LOC112568493 [Pomacea canaliculata]|uniref:uncharacterized protein LOC112568493 n=1 Tax=Pomacea canaliculata TaxID=400727 RepID=UPI000D73996B|nr:uncharacterized protein LOC112568493 [Pomacea canaliculata]